MGMFRKRVKTKGKRWIKGQSSNSNPSCKTFRKSATNNFFKEDLFGPTNASGLTVDALKRHNNLFGTGSASGNDDGSRFSENFSFSNVDICTSYNGTIKTSNSFASDWSCCTNMTFNKLLNRFDLTSAHHKEMLAVLAAVTEVIKANGGTENTTEYFAALITTLDGIEEGKCDSIAAILALLSMCIKSVPREILQLKFSTVSEILLKNLKHYIDSDNNIILKSLLTCLSVLLRSQEISVWNNSSTFTIYDAILAFIVHNKSKIRKTGQHAVCSILKGSVFLKNNENDYIFHPASSHTAKYCIQIMENCIVQKGMTTVLHILVLLKEIIAVFPKAQLKTCCETILKLMTLKNALVISCGLQTLHGLFISRPNISACPATLNAQLITALYDYQPHVTDLQPILAWSAVMQEAFVNLALNDLSLCMANVPKLFNIYTSVFLCDKAEVINNVTMNMQVIIKDCVAIAANEKNIQEYFSTIQKVFEILNDCLKYQYHTSWKQILYLLSSMYKVCGKTCQEFMIDCLKSLADLRDSDDFAYENEVDHVFGAAIESIGPELIIREIPLQMVEEKNSKFEIKRSWLLPLLKQYIKNSSLICFVDNFLPMATFFQKKYEVSNKTNNKISAVSYELLQSQIWALLPSFCDNAADIKETFPKIAQSLGNLLSTRNDLRSVIMSALRKLINCCKNNNKDIDVMAKFAKNYLPILFNIYTTECKRTDEEAARVSAFETIKVYLTIAESSLTQDLLKRALNKLESEEAEKSKFCKESILDLIRVLIPFQPSDLVMELFNKHIKKVENIKNFKEEKKYYRLLEDLCSCQSEGCNEFINANLSTIKKLLTNTLSSAALTSRGPRIRTVKALLLYDSSAKTVFSFLPEAVMCCKEGNQRCRLNAFELITSMANTMEETNGESGFGIFLDKLCAGLIGSTSMISATILALSSVIHTFQTKLIREQFEAILKNICILSQSKTREIVGPSIGFLKVVILLNDHDFVMGFLPLIVKTLTGITEDCKRKFRQKIRDIYDRLMRKFGADIIIPLVPTHDGTTLTRLKAIKKIQNRKNKQKLEQKEKEKKVKKNSRINSELMFNVKQKPKTINEILAECDDDDGDDDDEISEGISDDEKNKIKKKKFTQNIYLKEDEDSIIDFTSPTANKNVTTIKPEGEMNEINPKLKKKTKVEFPTAPDGRLLILEKKEEKLPSIEEFDSDEKSIVDVETEGNLSRMLSDIDLSRKRKRNSSDDDEPSRKYQAGGSGIHRKINKNSERNIHSGECFRANKAKGDVKKKGKFEPYAYVPLSRNTINRRKKKKFTGQFKSIVQSAKKGAVQGSKNKFKNKKRNSK